MYCPNCKQEFEGKFCPECGAKLIEKTAPIGGFNIEFGDANAVSGGVNLVDSHDYTDNSGQTIYQGDVKIEQHAAQKTDMEILQENKILYLNDCRRAYEDNVLEQAEVVALERRRIELGLDHVTADSILESVKNMAERNARKTSLSPVAKTKLKILTANLKKNEVKALMDQIDELEAVMKKYEHDELSRKYFLVLAALKPEKCIELKENSKIDSYWKSFWSYAAYIKVGRVDVAENILATLDRFADYPEDNMTVLAVAGALMKNKSEDALEYLDAVVGDYTPALQCFVDSIYLLLKPEMAQEMGANENTCAFYLVNFFGQKDPKAKAEEEANLNITEEITIPYTLDDDTGTFTGKLIDGKPLQGIFTSDEGDIFEGEWKNGMPYKGTMTMTDGGKFEGEFKDGTPYNGMLTDAVIEGNTMTVRFVDGEINGFGNIQYADGGNFIGEFKDGEPYNGMLTDANFDDGDGKITAKLVEGEANGYGTINFADGSKFEGELKDGKPYNGKMTGIVMDDGSTVNAKIVDGESVIDDDIFMELLEVADRQNQEEEEERKRQEEEERLKAEAERKRQEEEERKRKADELARKQLTHTLTITGMKDQMLCIMTTGIVLGWSAAESRRKLSKLPVVALETNDIDEALKTYSKLIEGEIDVDIQITNGLGEIVPDCKKIISWDKNSVNAILKKHIGNYMLFNLDGELLSNNGYSSIEPIGEGVICVQKNKKHGLCDEKGNEIVKCKYDAIDPDNKNYLFIVKKNNKYGYIDKSGREVIPCKFDEACEFHEGLAKVGKIVSASFGSPDYKYGYIDSKGKIVVPFKYDGADDFCDGLAQVDKRKPGLTGLERDYGYIDKNDREVIPFDDDLKFSFSDGRAQIKINGLWGYLDLSGKKVIDCTYKESSNFVDGLARVKNANDEWGIINKDGHTIVTFDHYAYIGELDYELIRVKNHKNKWGFIDKNGKEIIRCKYSISQNFHDNAAAVKRGGHWGLINNTGEELTSFDYDGIAYANEGMFAFWKNDHCGFMNSNGKIIIPCKYVDWVDALDWDDDDFEDGDCEWSEIDDFPCFHNGMVCLSKDDKWCLIDKNGNEIIQCKEDIKVVWSSNIIALKKK